MIRGLATALTLALTLTLASSARAQPTCVACHASRAEPRLRAPVADARRDVHGAAGIVCVDCHGGDPDATTARAHDLGRGFRGVPDALGTAILCGSCHDGTREGAGEVLDAFREGAHARATAAGRPGAATCTSCHGAHGIAPADAPDAPTSRDRVVELCAGCHASPEQMTPSGLPTDQAEQWHASVHGSAVLAGSEDAPVCASCHDPHSTGSGLVATQACSTCHEEIASAFAAGPHAEAFSRLGFVDCAECHGSHEIRPADAQLLTGLGAACARCHGEGQAVFERVGRIAAQAARLDAARSVLPRQDPRRTAVIAAVHALDADALEQALEGLPAASVAPPGEAPSHTRTPTPAWRFFALPIGVALASAAVALVVFVVMRRKR